MFIKSFFATAAVAAVIAGASAPANAKVNVDLYLGGFGPGYYEPSYPVYDGPHHPPRRPHFEDDYSYGISCEDGRQEVKYAGFRKVRAINCDGRRYTYRARRDGETYVVKVSRRSGDIISVQRSW